MLYNNLSPYFNPNMYVTIPTLGKSNTSTRWDSSRWVYGSSADSVYDNKIDVFGTGGDIDPGFSPSGKDNVGPSGTGSMPGDIAQTGAISGLTSAALGSAVTAGLTGIAAGTLSNSLSQGINAAVSSFTSPSSIAGMVGGTINGALGLSGQALGPMGQTALGALTGLATAMNPALGIAVGILGPMGINALGDLLDSRELEALRDEVEEYSPSYFSGVVNANHIANTLTNDLDLSPISNFGDLENALGELGTLGFNSFAGLAQNNPAAFQSMLSASYADVPGMNPELASIVAQAEMVANQIGNITAPDFGISMNPSAEEGHTPGNPAGGFMGELGGQFGLSDNFSNAISNAMSAAAEVSGTATQGGNTAPSGSIGSGNTNAGNTNANSPGSISNAPTGPNEAAADFSHDPSDDPDSETTGNSGEESDGGGDNSDPGDTGFGDATDSNNDGVADGSMSGEGIL